MENCRNQKKNVSELEMAETVQIGVRIGGFFQS